MTDGTGDGDQRDRPSNLLSILAGALLFVDDTVGPSVLGGPARERTDAERRLDQQRLLGSVALSAARDPEFSMMLADVVAAIASGNKRFAGRIAKRKSSSGPGPAVRWTNDRLGLLLVLYRVLRNTEGLSHDQACEEIRVGKMFGVLAHRTISKKIYDILKGERLATSMHSENVGSDA